MRLDVRTAKHVRIRDDRAKLRQELREGYLRENETNRQLAEEWFLLDEEAWKTVEEK